MTVVENEKAVVFDDDDNNGEHGVESSSGSRSHQTNDMEKQLNELRSRAQTVLNQLDNEVKEKTSNNIFKEKEYFDRNGFLCVPNFVPQEECTRMKNEMIHLVNTEWDAPFKDEGSSSSAGAAAVFRTDSKQESAQGSNSYFLDSANKVHFFAEQGAMEDSEESSFLKEEYRDNKVGALNKAGHGLHLLKDSTFYEYTTSDKLQHLVQNVLGYKDPVVPQSMYIFKQPFVGSEVTSHQDSTFLFTTPKQTCLGLWLALDDATLENGCLWVRPKSHKEPLRRKFIRNEQHFGNESKGIVADKTKPFMIFESLSTNKDDVTPWEGSLPNKSWPLPSEGLWDVGFVPVECHAGDLVCFIGTLDHLSLPNVSSKQRHTFQLHLVEGPKAGITWSPTNWLQYPSDQPFLRIGRDQSQNQDDNDNDNKTTP